MAILYKANETDFTHFGLGPLNDAVSILVTEERNGIFELTMEYPVSGGQFNELKNDRLIKADAGHNLKDQRFKIIRITKPLKGIVTVYAEHVSYLAQDLALRPRVPFSGNAEQALLSWQDGLVDDNPFIVSSDITTRGNGVWTIDEVENPRRALGGVDGSILDVYGGEYHFNNYQIRLMRQRGVNSATLIAYGRNLVDLTQEEEIANTYTSIYPYSVFTDEDGEQQLVTLPEYYIDSEHVDNFARRKILAVDFTTDEIETEDALRSAANRYITANNVGVPKVNLKIKYIDLAKTLDYKHQAVLEEVNLCDNVPVYFEKFDINTTAKVIKTVWDDLRGQYDSVEIGEARSSLSQSINATVDGKLEKVEKQITNVQLQADGMKLIYRQVEEPPPGENVGDLWYQPDGQYEIMYQWDGSMWKEVLNTRDLESVKRDVDEALEDAKSAKNRANESVEKAELATSNANEAIEQAQGAFDKAQESLEGLDTLVSITDAQGEELTTIKGGIEGLEVSVTDAEENITALRITSESFATRIEDAEGNISSISQTADGLQRRISDAEGNISSVTELATGMQTRLTDAEGNINTLTQTASSLESTITGVRDDLDGLEIGGRNLIRFSKLPSFRRGVKTSHLGIETMAITAPFNAEYINPAEKYSETFTNGETYTFSFLVAYDGTLGTLKLYASPNLFGYTTVSNHQDITTNKFVRVYVTGTATSNLTPRIHLSGSGTGTVYVADFKVEKGNKATDWTPAPEDMATQSQITQLSDNINLRVKKDDVINQINISDESVLISGKKLILDGDTTVTGTFRVKDANIESVIADKLIGGTADFAQFNAININANSIASGTIDTNLLTVRGGSGNDYAMIDGSYMELRGRYNRTWQSSTTTHDVRTRLQHGHLRFRNDSLDRSLYGSEFGWSTFVDGEGEAGGSSGSLIWWDKSYSAAGHNGITLHSHAGTPAIVSNHNKVIIHPMAEGGGNVFHFTKSSDYRDGYLLYNNIKSDGSLVTHGGFRFIDSFDGRVEVVDSNFSTGGNTSIKAGIGEFASIERNGNIDVHSHRNENGTHFRFTKSADRKDGYIVYGAGGLAGFRIEGTSAGRVQVVDSNFSTGGTTEIESGIGRFNDIKRRSGNSYVDIAHQNLLRVGDDSDGGRVASLATYKRTYSSGANMHITDSGTFGRSTSARKYKRDIEPITKEHAYNFFDNVTPIFYRPHNTHDENMDYSHYGYIADDVAPIEPRLVQFGQNGEPESFNYDRVPTLLHVVMKNEITRIDGMEDSLKRLDNKIDDEVSTLRKEKEELVMKVAELESRINKMESVA